MEKKIKEYFANKKLTSFYEAYKDKFNSIANKLDSIISHVLYVEKNLSKIYFDNGNIYLGFKKEDYDWDGEEVVFKFEFYDEKKLSQDLKSLKDDYKIEVNVFEFMDSRNEWNNLIYFFLLKKWKNEIIKNAKNIYKKYENYGVKTKSIYLSCGGKNYLYCNHTLELDDFSKEILENTKFTKKVIFEILNFSAADDFYIENFNDYLNVPLLPEQAFLVKNWEVVKKQLESSKLIENVKKEIEK